jgi:hypothetical protein
MSGRSPDLQYFQRLGLQAAFGVDDRAGGIRYGTRFSAFAISAWEFHSHDPRIYPAPSTTLKRFPRLALDTHQSPCYSNFEIGISIPFFGIAKINNLPVQAAARQHEKNSDIVIG